MANPNSYGDPQQPYGSHVMYTTPQRPPLHQMPYSSVNQHSNRMLLPRGPSGPLQPPPRPDQTMFPPLQSSSYPPPPHGTQPLYPPMPPNFSYAASPPFTYAVNNVVPPQPPPMRFPPPSLDTRPLHPPHNQAPSENVQSNTSRSNAELFLKTIVLKTGDESNESDKNKQDGKKKIMAWLQKIGKGKPGQKPQQKKNASKLQINDYLCSLQTMNVLMSKMSSQIEMLESTMSTADKISWAKYCSEFTNTKEQLAAMDNLLDSQVVSQVGIKLKRIRQKRARIRRGKQALREQHLKVQELRHTRETRIDEWQRQIAEEMREEKQKKERKINMDRTLAEVTKKIQDANRLVETMSAVEKLRLIRRDAAEKRGDSDLGESRQNVAEKIEDMKRLVKGQLEVYKEEERVLRDTIKLEYEESTKKEKQMQQERDEAERKENERNLYTTLFGGNVDVDISDPLYPYQEFYKQAQNNLPALIQIRQEWDRYITSNDSGSAIPSSWVSPSPPNSEAWATALVQE